MIILVVHETSASVSRRLSELLLDHGFQKLQRNLFRGNITRLEYREVVSAARRMLKTGGKICLVRLCKECSSRGELLRGRGRGLLAQPTVLFL